MLKDKKILFTILIALLLLIPNIVKAEEINSRSRVDVQFSYPAIGKNIPQLADVTASVEDGSAIEILSVSWIRRDLNSGNVNECLATDVFEQGFSYDCSLEVRSEHKVAGQVSLNNGEPYGMTYIDDDYYYGKTDVYKIVFHELIPITSDNNETEQKTISTIDVTLPEPKIGEVPASKEKIIVKLNGVEKIDAECIWCEGDTYWVSGSEYIFKENREYAIQVGFWLPENYKWDDTVAINVNGKKCGVAGESCFRGENEICFVYSFGTLSSDSHQDETEEENIIKKIDIKFPFPTIGGKPCSLKDIIVMTGEGVKVKIDEINWYEGDPFVDDSWKKEIKKFEAGKKYSCMINLLLPSGEHLAGWPSILLNGKEYGSAGVEGVSFLDDRKQDLYDCYL